MGRRKNKNGGDSGNEANAKKTAKESGITEEAKRSIAAVLLFALVFLMLLSFFGYGGALGQYLDSLVRSLFGWGKWILPLMLAAAGIILLFHREIIFYVTKLIGLTLFFASTLGFFHIYFNPEEILEIAKSGKGGGYIGYAAAAVLLKFAGVYAGTIILAAFFLTGVILTFNFSLALFLRSVYEKIKRKKPSFVRGPETAEGGDVVAKEESADIFSGSAEEENKKEEGEGEPAFVTKKVSAPLVEVRKRVEKPGLLKGWKFPPLELLEASSEKAQGGDVEARSRIIQETLEHFGIKVELGDVQVGPTVTQYSFRPAVGVKLSRITALSNDLSLALAAHPIRIEAPIPGKSWVGIEVPNQQKALVRLRNLLQGGAFQQSKSKLITALGEDVSGSYFFADLGKMPHLLVAGATGTGKSICINSIILSLLYRNSPNDLRFIFVDPKRVELTLYDGIPHLYSGVIVENGRALQAFKWAIMEMEKRYRLLQDTKSRDLESYNEKVGAGQKRKYIDEESGEEKEEEFVRLPYIIVVVDELADLMASHGKEVEGAIIRLAQMARAVGIHLILSTQRPSVEVLTGLIKANITTRIAFKVATQIDSRTILDSGGAEKLLGDGDMLFLSSQSAKLKRLQGVFVSEAEVKRVVDFIRKQKARAERDELESFGDLPLEQEADFGSVKLRTEYEDSLYEDAKKVVMEVGKASTSFLQRRLRVGYSRAARLLDMLESEGVVGPAEGSKGRKVLIKSGSSGQETDSENPGEKENEKWRI